MADILVEIPSEDWCKLRDLYSVDDPKTYLAHCTVDNYIRYLEREPNGKDWHIYSLNGDWSDGTYILIVSYSRSTLYCCLFHFDTPELDAKSMLLRQFIHRMEPLHGHRHWLPMAND